MQVLKTRKSSDQSGNKGSRGKRTYHLCSPCQEPISEHSQQEPPCNKPEATEELCDVQTFQDGVHHNIKRHAGAKRLVHQTRLEICILLCANAQECVKVPLLSLEWHHKAVQLPCV